MKKIFLLLSIAVILFLFAGCAEEKSSLNTDSLPVDNISEEFRMSVIYHYMNKTEEARGIAFSGYHWDMIDNGKEYHIDWNNSVDIEMFERFWR